jgi:hypothetical protein
LRLTTNAENPDDTRARIEADEWVVVLSLEPVRTEPQDAYPTPASSAMLLYIYESGVDDDALGAWLGYAY